MQLYHPPDKERHLPGLPYDCQEWLGQRELLRLCLEAVQSLPWDRAPLCTAPTLPHRPQMLMTLLSYCYARGIYESDDIAQAAHTNWTIRYICAHNIPQPREISQFRRMRRDSLVQCLSQVLESAVRSQFDQLRALNHHCPPHRLVRQARESACHRIDTAALIDSTAPDY